MSRDSETVSKNMRSIHSKDTSIELQLRKALWHKGYRYRKNIKPYPAMLCTLFTGYPVKRVHSKNLTDIQSFASENQ